MKIDYGNYMIDSIAIHYDKDKLLLKSKNMDNLMEFIKNYLVDNDISYYTYDKSWELLFKKNKRSLDTVFLPKNQKEKIVEDLTQFYSDHKTYQHFGVPYKRNYLLHGLPGTGKSTLVYSLASHFNKNIAILPLDSDNIIKVVSNIPNDCFLLIEDIDKTTDSFDKLLSVLDGVESKPGLVCFITTNHYNRIPKTILRPGRIDYRLEFKNITEYQITNMFKLYFPQDIEHVGEFLKKVKKNKLTTSMLQQFFFQHRNYKKSLESTGQLYKMFIESYEEENSFMY